MAGDDELVERIKKGDSAAFRELWERYRTKVFALAQGMLRNREDAMDVVQEAFVRVFRNIGQFHGESSFYTWLYRITMNLCIDKVRRASANAAGMDYDDARDHTELEHQVFPLVGQSAHDNPLRSVEKAELREKINEALEELPEIHRQILLLREVEGLSYQEIADTLTVPIGTVMSRLFHARHKVQAFLGPYLGRSAEARP